jgi:hypothetical protein
MLLGMRVARDEDFIHNLPDGIWVKFSLDYGFLGV